MMNLQFPSDKFIIDCLRANYNIEVESIIPLSEGADINAAIYKTQSRNKSSYFVKLKRNENDNINVKILELLHSHGIQQIILPIKTIHDSSILYIDNFCLIIYPFIEGVNGFNHKLTNKQWIMLGKTLRQVHDFDVPSSFIKYIRKETYSPKWRQTVRSFYGNIQKEQHGHDAISLKFLNFMKENRLIIQRLIDRAEQLYRTIKKQSAKFVLCHSDIHGGNVLIKENNTIYILDWDEPIMAPKERDLMFIGGGIANVWNDLQEEFFFYKGYGITDINISILAYYRHERIIQDIAEYEQALLLTKPDNVHKNRAKMYKQFISMFDPNGVVDIAFKTDEIDHF